MALSVRLVNEFLYGNEADSLRPPSCPDHEACWEPSGCGLCVAGQFPLATTVSRCMDEIVSPRLFPLRVLPLVSLSFFAHLPPTYISLSPTFSLILFHIVSFSRSSQLSLFLHCDFCPVLCLRCLAFFFILLFPLRLIPVLRQNWYRDVFVILGLFVDN